MTNTVANILQGTPLVTGGVLKGTASATLPTTAVATTTGFTALGYVGDAGVTESIGRTTDKIKAWGGDVVKVVQTEFSVSYQFTLYETLNAEVLKAVHGDANVTTTAATSTTGTLQSVKINSATMPKLPWVLDMKDGTALIRVAIPLGQINAVGDVTYNDGAVIGYPVTIEAFADTSGNQAYKYIDDGVFSA
jgi:hypothetical protein